MYNAEITVIESPLNMPFKGMNDLGVLVEAASQVFNFICNYKMGWREAPTSFPSFPTPQNNCSNRCEMQFSILSPAPELTMKIPQTRWPLIPFNVFENLTSELDCQLG